jgi:chromosomal replication initiator protein
MVQEFPFDHFLKINKAQKPVDFINSIENTENNSHEFDQEELNNINNEVLNALKNIVPEIKYKTYFQNNLNILKIEEHKIIYSVKTQFVLKFVINYKEEISNTLVNVLGRPYEIEFKVIESNERQNINEPLLNLNIQDGFRPRTVSENKFSLELTPTKEDLAAKAHAQYIEHMNPNKNGILIDKDKTFENFIVGPTNNMAQAAAKAVAQTPGKNGKYPSLYIHSNSGLGKTHLLHAVANEIFEKYPSLNVCLITARDFMDEMIELMKKNQINEFVKKYTERIDVLMIDDIHELKNKEGTQDQFFHVFNEMHNKGKQLIFTSDKRPKEIDGISERIKTRLQWGLVVDIQPPDLETRIAILRRKMESLDLYVTEDVLTLIASKIKTNIRELEGSLVKLKAVSELMNVEIEIDLVKDQLMFNNGEDDKQITMEQISKAVAQHFRIPLADLKSKSRNQDITKARHIAMYLARVIANSKQQEIGEYFGGRDHTSVIHAVDSIKKKMKTDQSLSKDINSIESNL